MSTYKKISSLNQNMNPSFKTKIDFAKHSNLYLNYSHPKRSEGARPCCYLLLDFGNFEK